MDNQTLIRWSTQPIILKIVGFLLSLLSAVCPWFWANCYQIVNIVHRFSFERINYADAKEFCETAAKNGFKTGFLFEPRTKSFNDKVYSALKRKKRNAWIGINSKGGPWVYTRHGAKKLYFENWNPHMPRFDNSCGFLFYGNGGKWGDAPCENKSYFICEFV